MQKNCITGGIAYTYFLSDWVVAFSVDRLRTIEQTVADDEKKMNVMNNRGCVND